ncbi:helix-turn-helix domain-containing protein [Streptomyces sp. VRA16 Mangrove soil]|uniref:winged helix-turn-helix transcriptional regulator n=1 Tax=Streptomyces sp. VRA16 Mangrove soil TaxID=2817434 RepID=UPI001A9DE4D4|nr:helix-turn-helix domain-containing protein [Streptomyces sp. VRA16 Mangrove soil]MBO1332770.1 helix-turn-helix transcriptional regulator [Streptomyces sp. VRA16 Mangrove soil]
MEWLETSTENCPVQRALDVVGEKWTLQILRDAVNGVRRFDDFHRHIGLSEAVLSNRLRSLTAAGVLETVVYREPGRRARNEYQLTGKGWDLWPVLLALGQWGETHAPDPEGPVLEIRHTDCGAPVRVAVQCSADHTSLAPRDVTAQLGAGARRRS